MRPSASTLSPLAIAALLASLAAHASVAMYIVDHPATPRAVLPAVDTMTTMDVETVALPAPTPDRAPPEVAAAVQPNVVPAVTASRAAPLTKPAETAPAPVTPVAAAAPVVGAAEDDSPHFAMVVGAGATAPGGLTKSGGTGTTPGLSAELPAAADAPLPASGVDELAQLESGPAPAYPSDAKENGVEADVPLDIVVDESGRVIDVRATKHLGYGLDEAASRAIRGYRFSPARRGGRAVKVRMRWTVVFRLS